MLSLSKSLALISEASEPSLIPGLLSGSGVFKMSVWERGAGGWRVRVNAQVGSWRDPLEGPLGQLPSRQGSWVD